jgi:hypothetical protein
MRTTVASIPAGRIPDWCCCVVGLGGSPVVICPYDPPCAVRCKRVAAAAFLETAKVLRGLGGNLGDG